MKLKPDPLEQYDLVCDDYIDKVASKYAPKIGKIFIQFSDLEHTLDITIIERLFDRSHDLGYLVIEGSSLNNKIELFRKLFSQYIKQIKPNRTKKFLNMVKRLHEARLFRNHIAHANWRTLDNSGYVRTKVSEKAEEIIFKKVRITPSALDAWLRRIERLNELLYEFTTEIEQA